jgi:hypothetical protein
VPSYRSRYDIGQCDVPTARRTLTFAIIPISDNVRSRGAVGLTTLSPYTGADQVSNSSYICTAAIRLWYSYSGSSTEY